MCIRVLAVSDQIDPRIHSSTLKERMPDVQLIFGCGDVPARYLEFLADALDRPVYFVAGNHQEEQTRPDDSARDAEPMGCVDLGGRVVRDSSTGLLLAGIPGSPRYCDTGQEQYTEVEVWWMIACMMPRLLQNRLRHGRALDVLITHAPPRNVNDRDDPPHRGFQAIRAFLRWFGPAYHLHGHVHLYYRNEPSAARFERTTVVNVFPYKVLDVDANGAGAPVSGRNQPSST